MRVISQDGTMDMPYEMSTMWCDDDGAVLLQPIGEIGEYQTFAKYFTKAKAIKAMEMLREAYVGMPIVMQNVDISEDVAKEFERLKKCGIMARTENQPSKVDFINNVVFQFPQDDEIEV
jgi:hypothetical protein